MPNVLYLDIETAPNNVYTWGLWNQNVSIEKIIKSGYVLCWAAKWEAEDEVMWSGLNTDKQYIMLEMIWNLLNNADFVVHYNGLAFDIPTLNAEFVQSGMRPPAPYKQIDLMKVVQKQFRFPSNKLDYVAQALNIGEKVKHMGFQLWLDCMAGHKDAWAIMKAYNEQDVLLLELLYNKLQPWVPYHPTRAAMDEVQCPSCGSEQLQRRGTYLAKTRQYQRYCCKDCNSWSRATISDEGKALLTSIRA